MALQRWDLAASPAKDDQKRWRLKLKITEDELPPIIASLSGKVGRPFLLEGDEYDFGIYLYEAENSQVETVRSFLQKICPLPGEESESKRLDSLLEKIASGLDSISMPEEIKLVEDVPQKKKPEPAAAAAEKASVKSASPAQKAAEPEPERQKPQIAPEPEPQEKTPPAPAPSPYPEVRFADLDINTRYTFEEFVIGPNNRFTAAAAQAVADNPGKIYNPFFIYGGVGLGKTHMMHAVGHYVRKKNPGLRILYVTTEKFMGEVIDAIRRGTILQMREHYRQVDLLLVDDIQFLVESEATQEEFFHTFNVLHQSGKQIIITSDRPPKQLTTLEDRLRSRFEWGLIADIKSPNLETRVAILKKKGESEHVKLDDNILLFIASKLKSNIRELEGFLKRINAYASLNHQEVNMELAQSLMADLLPQEENETAAPAAPPPMSMPAVNVDTPFQNPVPSPAMPAAAEPADEPARAVHEEETKTAKPQSAPYFAPPPTPTAQELRDDPVDSGVKSVEVGFFFPEGKSDELARVKERFKDVIKKHKLKFQLVSLFEMPYSFTGKINYAYFTELCKTHNSSIAIVLGPPLGTSAEAEDFGNLLSAIMDDERVSLQLISWAELNKDYRYLNLALDITLLKHKA